MTNESFPRYRRRHYLINKGLQTRFIIGFSLAVFLGFMLNLLFVYFLIDRELTRELYKIHIKIRTTSEIAAPILWQLGAVTVPVIVIASAVLGYYLTRRVEVPLVSFREAIRRAGHGDFTETLGGGPSGGLSKAFNRLMASLGKKFKSLNGSVEGIEGRCGELATSLEGGRLDRADALRALKGFSEARESVRRELSGFKV